MRVLIVGGGLGGLSLAVALHSVGIDDVEILEASPHLAETGVGLTLQPNAVAVLARYGLADELTDSAVELDRQIAFSSHGEEAWRRPVGTAAGHPWPQYGIHRGRLQAALIGAITERLGRDRIRTGHRLVEVTEHDGEIEITVADGSDRTTSVAGTLVVGADGARSTVRHHLHPSEPEPEWDGFAAWRGLTYTDEFLGEAATVMAGHSAQVLWAFPVRGDPASGEPVEVSWVAHRRLPKWRLEPEPGWATEDDIEDLIGWFHALTFDGTSTAELIRRSDAVYQHPVLTRPPLERWSSGRMTLLGDAAHPLPPVGSVGASQAILDAAALADALAREEDVGAALDAYEGARRGPANRLVELAERGGPIAALDLVEERGLAAVSSTEIDRILEDFDSAAGIEVGI